MGVKGDVIKILVPIFGEMIEKTVDALYDENEPQELYEMVRHMLSGVVGQKNADTLLHERLDFKKLGIKGV